LTKGDVFVKILVTGFKGQLGYDVVKVLNRRNIDCIGVDKEEFDITDYEAARNFILGYAPDAIIHCSAYTAVDKAEDEKQLCEKVNHIGPKNIAKVCKEINAKLIYISTDYVFPGIGENFYEINDKTSPTSVYGLTKLAGEKEVKNIIEKYFIVRISWAFGKNGHNFVKTMINLGKEKNQVNVVCDQIGSPTYTVDLAQLLCDMVMTDKYGTYHATNESICSWAEFAEEIFKQTGIKTKVNYINSDMYSSKAKRPLNSRMSKKSLDENGFKRLPEWKNALKRYLIEIDEYKQN